MSGAGDATCPRAARTPQPFPWRDIITFGLAHLRLAPKDFWMLTPRELSLMTRAPPALAAQHFAALMRRYPDGIEQT